MAERRIYQASTGGGLIPLPYILNIITGRMAMLKRQLKYQHIETKKDKALTLMPDDFYTEALGIPKAYVDGFIYYCLGFEEFKTLLKEATPLKLIPYLQEKAKTYKEGIQFKN